MQNGRTDADLLAQFDKTNDDIVFRELASRYSGLLFHTALRSLGNQGLAEDVVQRVLLSLAKKAGPLAKSPVALSAWLHRATILEAKSARRVEMRQQRKKLAPMQVPADPPHLADSQWSEALPHLDAAIDRLSDADRTVILLHYVNGLTFPQIAVKIGKSAAAVQKQSRRALEVLQRTLARRGVTLSLVLVTACLTSEMSKAGPILAIPAPAVLAHLCKSKTSLFLVKKSSVLTLAATVILCGVPLARQQVTLHELETQSARIKAADSEEPRKTRSAAVVKTPSLIERLARDLKTKNSDMPRYLTATEHLSGLDDDALVALIREAISSPVSRSDREIVFGHLLDILSERDRESALTTLMEVVPLDFIVTSARAKNILINGIANLANSNGPRALAWFNAHLESFHSIQLQPEFVNDRLEDHLRTALAKGLIFSDAGQAIEVLRTVPREQVVFEFQMLADHNQLGPGKDASGFIRVVRELFPAEKADESIARIVGGYCFNGFKSIDGLLESYPFTPGETDAILIASAARHFEQASREAGRIEQVIPNYRDWLESKSTADIDQHLGAALGKTVVSWSSTSEPIYQVMLEPGKLGLGEQAVVRFLETAGSKLGIERSTKLAENLSDQDAARQLLERIKKGGHR